MEHSLITSFSLAHTSTNFSIVSQLVSLGFSVRVSLLDHVFGRCLDDSCTDDSFLNLLILLLFLTGLFVFLFGNDLLLIVNNHSVIGNE